MKTFKIEMFSMDARTKTVEIEAKTKAEAKRKWEKLFGSFWMIVKIYC